MAQRFFQEMWRRPQLPPICTCYTVLAMSVNENTVQVSFRLERQLVTRMRRVCDAQRWPPPPSQTEIVRRGIEMVLLSLKKGRRGKPRKNGKSRTRHS